MENEGEVKFIYFVLICAASGGVMYTGKSIYHEIRNGHIPRDEVQIGYVKPSDLEIKVEDLDPSDKLPETYLVYEGEKYALTKKDGKPYITKFKVEKNYKLGE